VFINACFWAWHNDMISGTILLLWNLADPLLSVTIFPILMALCLKKVEGSQFTTYLALINLCDVLGSYVTGWGLNVVSSPLLGFLSGLFLLLLLLFLWYRNYQLIPEITHEAASSELVSLVPHHE